MLTQACIQQIKDTQLSAVVSHYVQDLKRKGTNYQACCPFHDEKTASFVVSDTKGIYKCFGCGKSGGAINFVMQKDNSTFYEACKKIAAIANIPLEHEPDNFTEDQKKQYIQKKTAADQQEQVLNYVIPVYQKMLHELPAEHPAKIWLAERKITDETIEKWQLGWAGEAWNTVTTTLINKNLWDASAKLGISRRSQNNESNYDGYRNRITFPIKDRNGRYIGLGGRYIKTSENDAKEIPKYINTGDCELYNKSAVLFGLDEATESIKREKSVNITEGYMDVISPAQYGLTNTVATCGTAFTKDQMLLLKKYCSHVIMFRDNDKAGYASFASSLPELLSNGFKVDIRMYNLKDPDEYFLKGMEKKQYQNGHAVQCIDYGKTEDAIIHFAKKLWVDAAEDLHTKAIAKAEILNLLACISNDIIKNNYFDSLCKLFKWKPADTKKEFAAIQEITPTAESTEEDEAATIKFATWMSDEDKETFLTSGYIAVKRKHNGKPMVGYFSFNQNGKSEITNFIINPLFRIEAGQDSRYLSEIDNGYKQAVVDMPAKVFPSIEQFQGMCVSAGGSFLIYGSRNQWLRIATDLLHGYPSSIEITSLGWQTHGFFAWVDKAYIPGKGLVDYDKWGIINHNEKNYLVPASSEAYKALQHFGSDPYENMRCLTYRQSPVDFKTWAAQMYKVYDQKGIVAIAYIILTLFRDIVFEVDNNCPHLYGFGEPSSGKSKWAESITALFFYKRAAFNLNSGTDFAFFLYMSLFLNCPAHLNEFDIEVIKPEWFQAIKGAYDGEGRVRGKLGSKNSTEIQKIVSTLILTGQKLITADDNSVVTRSDIEPFSTAEYTEERKKDYDLLKEWEGKGLSSMLTEVLQHREFFEKEYRNKFNEQLSDWRKNRKETVQLNQRILQNFSHLCTAYNMLSTFIVLPQAAKDFTDYCYAQAVKWSTFIRSSDTLSEFWRTLEFLANQDQVMDGWDFMVQEEVDCLISINRNESRTHSFDKPTKVLYLRINNIHKLFQATYRTRTGKEAMSMENLLHYFSSRKYYIGPVRKKKFTRFINVTAEVSKQMGLAGTSQHVETRKEKQETITSCYAFIYDMLEIDITRSTMPEFHENNENEKSDDLPF